MTVRAARARQLVGVAFGLAMLVIGIGLEPRLAGWIAIALGVVGLVAGVGGIVPGAAYLRFSPAGLTVKYAFLPARTVPWPDITAVTSELVPMIRHRLPSLVVTYADGYTGPILGQRLDGSRSYIGNFTGERGDKLAATANEYRERYGAGPAEPSEPADTAEPF